ncbi:MAG: hypothetical protein GX359_04340 [Clostridiales bacterium]|nr:hypothetical protein [Clostridiales bacterium]
MSKSSLEMSTHTNGSLIFPYKLIKPQIDIYIHGTSIMYLPIPSEVLCNRYHTGFY